MGGYPLVIMAHQKLLVKVDLPNQKLFLARGARYVFDPTKKLKMETKVKGTFSLVPLVPSTSAALPEAMNMEVFQQFITQFLAHAAEA